jgi:hypothetical protein
MISSPVIMNQVKGSWEFDVYGVQNRYTSLPIRKILIWANHLMVVKSVSEVPVYQLNKYYSLRPPTQHCTTKLNI